MPGEFGFFVRNVFAQPSGHRILGLAGLVDGLRVRVALLKTQYGRGGVSRVRPSFVPGAGVPSLEPRETYTFGQLKLNIGVMNFGRIPDGVDGAERRYAYYERKQTEMTAPPGGGGGSSVTTG